MNPSTGSPSRQPGAGLWPAGCLIFIAVVSLLATTLQAANPRVVITPAAGFTINWDGNNGGFFSPAVGAGPADNIALASHGTTPFASSELGPVLSPDFPYHRATNLNDGFYGNNKSWISADGIGGTTDPDPFAGLGFAASVDISSIAWGRDNGNTVADDCGGTCTDRCVDTYTLQYTTVTPADATTPDTGDAATGWATIGTVQYLDGADNAYFSAYLRHRFDIALNGAPFAATGIRIKVANGWTDIDEIEVNPQPDPDFLAIAPTAGFSVTWDGNEGKFSTPATPALVPVNDASISRGAVAFGSSEFGGGGAHLIANVNDGFYGNSHSWISDFTIPDPDPFIGLRFGRPIVLQNIAWGRDNGDASDPCAGGVCTDRALGVYTLQVTSVPDPGVATPEACGPFPSLGWATIATLDYRGDSPVFFNSYLRHRYNVAQDGQPLVATGIRIKVPNSGTDIDEIEVNANLALEGGTILITNAPSVSITWDGNDGQFWNAAAVAPAPPNRALVTEGTVAFASSQLGVALNLTQHFATNVNDGLYGNRQSWIADFTAPDPNPFVGLNFGGTVSITNIAWGRDNGNTVADDCGGTCGDRAVGTYTLQYTTVAAPDATTAETGDPTTGWAALGTVVYAGNQPPYFTSYLRHRFDVSAAGLPIDATGLRIKVSDPGMDIDEIEVNTAAAPPEPLPPVALNPAFGYTLTWDGNEGEFVSPNAVAPAPPNRALASQGTLAFTSSDLGAVDARFPYHVAASLNDGLYGNSNSWISADGLGGTTDPNPFAGLNFGGTILITNIAWSRDNGNTTETGCTAGTCTDRAVGLYILQVTTVPDPSGATPQTEDPTTGWATISLVEYRYSNPPQFTSYLRHRFDVATADGQPIPATGLLIHVPDGMTDIDEIEVNTLAGPQLTVTRSGSEAVITWVGNGALEYATSLNGPWTCIPDAVSGHREPLGPDQFRIYRLHR